MGEEHKPRQGEINMKMVIAILSDKSDARVSGRLAAEGYGVTRVASTGGFVRRGNVTLFIGVPDTQEQAVIDLLRDLSITHKFGVFLNNLIPSRGHIL
jgi:uncharacterized protein YaaQ